MPESNSSRARGLTHETPTDQARTVPQPLGKNIKVIPPRAPESGKKHKRNLPEAHTGAHTGAANQHTSAHTGAANQHISAHTGAANQHKSIEIN